MPASALEIFVKLDGIDGDSTVRGHEKETVVLAFEQDIANLVSVGGGGGGSGKAVFSPVRFRKAVDIGSVPLLMACASGAHIREARFVFRRAGAGIDYYKIVLEDVVVAHIAQRAGTGAQYPLSFGQMATGADTAGGLDEIALEYARVRWEYRPIGADGMPTGAITGGWDRVRSEPL